MVRNIPLDLNKIRNLIADIRSSIDQLSIFTKMDFKEFKSDSKNYGLTEHYFRRALKGVLTIGTHFLSRLPVKTKDYQEIIIALGEQNIIPKEFAERNKKLAGYRNRLVHIYWEVSGEELYKVINQHLTDLERFCDYFQMVLQKPEKFRFIME